MAELSYTPREREKLQAKRLKRMNPARRMNDLDAPRSRRSRPIAAQPRPLVPRQNLADAEREYASLQRLLQQGKIPERELRTGRPQRRMRELERMVFPKGSPAPRRSEPMMDDSMVDIVPEESAERLPPGRPRGKR